MDTPTTPAGREQLDRLDPLEAAVVAWTTPGNYPYWHELAREEVRRSMPLLARALDRAAERQLAARLGELGQSGHGVLLGERRRHRVRVLVRRLGRFAEDEADLLP